MSKAINVCSPEEIRPFMVASFANSNILPIIGSGFSCGLNARNGVVPDAKNYKTHMIKMLRECGKFDESELAELKDESFSKLCGYYEDDDLISPETRISYLRNNFYQTEFADDDSRRKLFEIDWPYIYTLNIDDAIENNSKYKTVILPNKEVREGVFNSGKCVVKMHGDIHDIVVYRDSEKIFTAKEYALSIRKNNSILNKLKNDFENQNILFIGCSLDDEIDLKTLTSISIENYDETSTLNRRVVFVKGTPGPKKLSDYKPYGITDVVCFDEYDTMYSFLLTCWSESQQIRDGDLFSFRQMSMNNIPSSEKDVNHKYFFWGKSLVDFKNKIISYPYHFVSRRITNTIISNLGVKSVHLVQGRRVSGKSYLLADIYRTIKDREVYFFDGKARLSDTALRRILDIQNIVALFDVGSLTRDQLETILKNAEKIKKQNSNYVICLNQNDADTMGIVKWKLNKGLIDSTHIEQYMINNRLSDEGDACELTGINERMPVINLPPYESKRTLLDQLIYAEKQMNAKGQYDRQHIKISSTEHLALLIILAIKEKLYSSELINFDLEMEIADVIKKYAPFIERIETNAYEKDYADYSSKKYVLNSKYWLHRELGDFARKESNFPQIAEAYQYIINKIKEFSRGDIYTQREIYRDYILYDTMNDIFLDQHKGNIKIIVYIYTKLHSILANDADFLHQKSKCYLNYANTFRNIEERKKYLSEALELVSVAEPMTEKKYRETRNERVQASLSHIRYTKATIQCEICEVNDYSDVDMVERTIDAIDITLKSPYNSEEYKREMKRRAGIIIHKVVSDGAKLGVSRLHQKKLESMRAY